MQTKPIDLKEAKLHQLGQVPVMQYVDLLSIARVAARNAFRAGVTDDAQLLAEAHVTDRLACSEVEMLVLLRAELARVQGQSRGGHVTAFRRQFKLRKQ